MVRTSTSLQPFHFVLASGSPRRKEFISYLNIPYEVYVSDIEEKSQFTGPQDFVVDIAKQKGEAVYEVMKDREGFGHHFFPVICAADTVVEWEGEIFGKPKNDREAKEMLMKLAGKTHLVITGVSLTYFSQVKKQKVHRSFFNETKVTFHSLTEYDLALYISTKDPLDKAGAYGIQGPALVFIEHLAGSYSNVVGLPLTETIAELQVLMQEDLLQNGHRDWRTCFYD